MVTFRAFGLLPLLAIVASALGTGSWLRRHGKVDYRTDLPALTVRGHGPFPYQVDGDYLGETEQLEFRHEPAALTIVQP